MPLFSFECPTCGAIIEKLILPGKNREILCEKCHEICKKLLSKHRNRTQLDAKTMYRDKILPETRRISKELNSGKDSTFLDIVGDK